MRSYFRTMGRLRLALVVLNYVIVMFYASVFLTATKTVVVRQRSAAFLDTLEHIPKNPLFVFFGCFGLYALFAALVLRHTPRAPFSFSSLAMEWGLAFVILFLLDFTTQSVVLLVICDGLFHVRDLKNSHLFAMLALAVLLYLGTNFSIMSPIVPLTDLHQYFLVFSPTVRALLLLLCSLIEGVNLLLFITFIACFTVNQYEEKESIAQELDMVNQVNEELRNYAALTEQIAQNNERKRIAREIHDTLGHALTGIAAGIDACLVMIDKKPEAVKPQLQRVRNVVTEGIGDVRNSLQKLRPGALEQQGLEGALKKMINEFISVSHVEITLCWQMPPIDFEKTKEDALFRMIQECITNSIRHGHANRIQVVVWHEESDPGHMRIVVKDNGAGCASIVPGYGLMQMQERIETIHGSLRFDGSNGFVCEARIPLQKGEWND
ncbi:sensor histidine kinase [Dubosiella muris]|uniref:Sensor histidine kinase n=1 Tax=Dubosiella muris TaxID=3038133 RepID=A0AC61R5V2_9FIRM|nr:sensor histidine kinase [Dubosiella muris]TGY65351.1 sensor histidine kinase [Dubosiella muris]